MSLRDLRPPTTNAEHRQAVTDAEFRLGRKLTTAEQRIDIVGQDRDLKNGKAALVAAIEKEQRRAIDAYARDRTPIHLHVTDDMVAALADLYDAGADHATRELASAGITVGD